MNRLLRVKMSSTKTLRLDYMYVSRTYDLSHINSILQLRLEYGNSQSVVQLRPKSTTGNRFYWNISGTFVLGCDSSATCAVWRFV